MKRHYTFLMAAFLLLALFTIPIGMRGQTTHTIGWGTASGTEGTYTNFTDVSGSIINVLSFTTAKNSSSSNPAYNANASELRLYYASNGSGGSITITPASGITITDAVMTTSTSPSVQYSVDGGTATSVTASSNTYTISNISASSSLMIQNVNTTNTQLRIKTIALTYTTSGSQATTYTVTYHANVAGTTDIEEVYYEGDDVTVAANTFSNPGYAFTEWNTAENGSGQSYAPDDVIEDIDDDWDLYAQWEESSEMTLNFPLNSNPNSWPTGTVSSLTEYTYPLNGVDYTFALKNVKYSTNYLMVYYVGAVGLPAIEGYKLTKVVASNSNGCSTATKVGISSSASQENYIDGGAIQTWSTQGSQYTYNLTSTEVNTMYYLYVTNKNAQIINLALTYEAATAPSVATPTFSPADGTEFGDEGLSVTITCETSGADIFYTLDGSEPDDESTPYNGAITLSETTTIKAIAYADDMASNVATATYTYVDPNAPGTVNNPYTVAQARDAIDANTGLVDVYATGIISQVDSYNTQYNSITYWISDDGTTTSDQLEVYSGKGLNNSNFSSIDDVEVGATVVVFGTLKKYNSTYEFDKNNYLVSYTAPIHAVETPTFSPVAGTYATTQMVTISCASDGADIFYTLDGSDPDDESEPYSGTITVTEATTIKAIAYADDMESVIATATYHICSQDNPYTVTQALNFAEYQYPANNVYVHGIVSTAPTSLSSGALTYYISVDGTATNELEVYKGKGLNNEAFTAADDIQVGDIVTIYGNVQVYNGTIEFGSGNYLVEFERPTTPAQEYTLTISNLVNVNTYVFAGDESEMLFEGEGSAQILEGTEVMISVDVEEGYVLQSLMVDGTDHAADIAGGMYIFDMPDHDVTVTATAVEDIPFESATYTLASSIESGKTYIIVGQADGDYYAMGQQNTNNRAAVQITVDGTTATVETEDVYEFTISSLETAGFYSIYDDRTPGYLYAASSSKNQLKTETTLDENNNGEWEITFDADGNASVVASNSSNRNVMQFNNSNTLFACYGSASMHPVFLYVKDETPVTETYPLTINGYGNNNQPSHYYLIASPVTVDLSNHELTTGEFDLYCFDQTQASEWQNWKDDTDGHFDLVPGMGYLYAHKTGGTFELSGAAYTGTGTVTLVKDDNAPNFSGWNLVGNPYYEVAYIQDGRDFYVLTDGSEVLPYDGNDIQPLQGIFVVATNNNESMTFTTTAPASTGEKFVFNISQGRGDVIDRAMVRFGEGRTLPKFQLHDTSTKLYIPQADDDYAVVYATEHGTLPLNFRAAENGAYTLSFDNQAGEFASLHLIDNKTRADIDLLTNPSYTFNAETTDDENRFTLVYSKAGDLTVTVCDGTNTNSKIPVNGLYADTEGTTSEFIIPATMDNMETLVGATITGMTFYINTATTTWGQTTIEVYMGEVDYTTLSSLQGPDDFTVVSTQDWDNTGSTIELVFDVPYEYGGGNLLIGTRVTACDDSYKSTPFVGTEGAAGCSRYNNGGTTETSQSFLPKTTFTYEEAPQGDCEKPTTVTASDVEAHSATLSWEGGSTPGNGYNVEVKGGQYTDWTRIYSNISQGCELTDLQDNTSYQARVQVVCSAPNEEEEASGWTIGRFTTPIACPAPTSLAVTLTPGDGTVAEFSWTENGEAISWQLCINDDENNLIDMDENPFTYDEFTPEQTYTAKVRAYCNDIDQSEWSNTVTFTPTDAYTITVNDSDNTNGFVPVYGYYVDATSMSQFIIPATDLEDMQWGTINKLTFYASQSNVAWAGTDYYGDYKEAAFEVYMAEVDHTTFTDGTPVWEGMLKVMDAALLGISDHQMEVTLDAPYQYMGGNLMIGIKQTASGIYGTSTWYGVNQTENTAIGNKSGSGTTQELKQFLPKTTFSYFPGEEPDCVTPQGLAVSSITNESAVATWNAGEAISWNLKYRMVGEEKRESEWITVDDLAEASYPFENLEAGTTYEVQVQANCGDALSDYCNAINFTTDFCTADDKCVVTLELTDAYGDGWGGAILEVVDAETSITIGTYTLEDGGSDTYTVNVCPDRTINFVYTPGSWPYENGYVFTDINNEVIAEHVGCTTSSACDAPTTGVVASYLVSCRPATCARPAGLAVTPYGSYAEVTWEAGEARSWEVCVDDDEENIIRVDENSCTIEGLEFSSDHTVRVRAYCGEEDGYSTWTQNVSFTTMECDDACSISYVLTANDYQGSYQYGWYNSGIKVFDARTGEQLAFWTVPMSGDGSSEGTLTLCPDTEITFEWYQYYSSDYDALFVASYAIYDHLGDLIAGGSGPMSENVEYTMDCTVPDCMWPTNITVEPSYTSATISWDGDETNTYNVQYRTAPVVFYDGFEYGLDNWTILVQGEVPSSGDFANGWATYGEASHSGNKTAASRSWVSDGSQAGLTLSADNWLISPMIEIQGTLKFWVACSYPNNADKYEVLLSTSGTAIRDFSVTLQDETAATGDWEPIEIDLSRYAGNRGYIAIRHHFTDGELLFVDDFGVYGPEETAGRWKDERITGTSIELVDLEMDSFYEFQIQNDCGNTQSDWKGGMFQTLNGNEKQFIHDGDWNKDDNWIPEGVPTAGQNATIKAAAIIPAGCVATIDNITITEDGSLLIRDGGQLVFQTGEVTATVEKNITGYKAQKDNYYLISTGMAGMDSEEVEGLLTNNYDYYWFDGSADLEWRNYESSPFNMKIGWGYLYANSNDDTLRFTGELLTPSFYYVGGSNSSYLTYDETKDYGTFNLVGNAFVTDGYISLYDANGITTVTDFYVMGDNGELVPNTKPTLSPNEGVFIEATQAQQLALTSIKEYNTKSSNASLNMTLTSANETVDRARIRFGEGHGLRKLQLNKSRSKLYMPVDNNDYAVVRGEAMGEMPVNFKAEQNGNYTLSFNNEEVTFSYLHLIDNLTGADVDLLTNPSYSFDAKMTDYASRFKLVYATGNTADSDNFGFISNNHLMILGLDGQATLKVMDVTGRTLSVETFSGSYDKALNLSNGVYMLQLIQGNNVKTQKIVVK